MSRIQTICEQARDAGRKLLVPYLVCGDPTADITLRLMHELVEQGADIIELGFPFSDPASDGPVIQRGVERALAGKTSLADCLAVAKNFRDTNTTTPVVLMGYLNPVEVMGYARFAEVCANSGVDGVLIVDMPPAEAALATAATSATATAAATATTPATAITPTTTLKQELAQHSIDNIFLVAPTTSEARSRAIVSQCSGYLYYVSLKGVTGAALSDTDAVQGKMKTLRALTKLPIVIGFGIKDADSAAAMAGLADGVVIGSALVQEIAKLAGAANSPAAEQGSGKHNKPESSVNDSQISQATAIISQARQAIDSIG
ncbi:MAG: tryptophan synthase subunit alpha [Pseudohongiellaceae bacterium]